VPCDRWNTRFRAITPNTAKTTPATHWGASQAARPAVSGDADRRQLHRARPNEDGSALQPARSSDLPLQDRELMA
jgi:hypothetical protein